MEIKYINTTQLDKDIKAAHKLNLPSFSIFLQISDVEVDNFLEIWRFLKKKYSLKIACREYKDNSLRLELEVIGSVHITIYSVFVPKEELIKYDLIYENNKLFVKKSQKALPSKKQNNSGLTLFEQNNSEIELSSERVS